MAKHKAPAVTERVTSEKPLKLTKKQEDFSRAYIKTGNGSAAYRAAYKADAMSADAIKVEASRILSRPNVSLRIAALMAPGLKKAAMDAEETILEIARVANQKPTKKITYGEKISALALLAKHHGLFEKDNKQRTESMALEVVMVPTKK